MSAVGIIGLGLMGSALAERFLRAGLIVSGYDVDAARRRALADTGGVPLESAGEVLERCAVVLLSLPTTDVVEGVLRGAHAHIADGTLIIDTTTGDPRRTAAIGAQLADAGVRYLDATVVGNSAQVRSSDVVVMAGGDENAFRQAEDFFRHFSKRWFHVGPWGAGASMKLVVNLVLGLNRAVLAEGLTFARHLGIEPAAALEVLRAGAAYSTVMDVKGRRMVEQDFTPDARLSQHLKDVRLILDEAARHDLDLPLSNIHRALLESAEAAGFGTADNSAIIRAFERPRDPATDQR